MPKVYQEFLDLWQERGPEYIKTYQLGKQTFVPNLLPEQAVELSVRETWDILRGRLGSTLDLALDPAFTHPDTPLDRLPEPIQSPVRNHTDGNWLKTSNMVGINVRTIGSFWQVVSYVLTLPATQDSIQLLPIWEPGVVGSIYGMSSWQLNQELRSQELAATWPHLRSAECQLRAVVNILHALGRTVGMDVIPHTDRFSEMALGQPQYFEWLQRQETDIVDHREDLYLEVQGQILRFLHLQGPAVSHEPMPESAGEFFGQDFPEERRLRILFGLPEEYQGRLERRIALIKHLHRYGYETVPATMAPPFRGLAVDTRPEARIVDHQGMVWRDYAITKPGRMSRVFGPLGRYRLYERLDGNRGWQIDFSRPIPEAWDYVCRHYATAQRRFGFDFMRGDMSHVQMRPNGVPDTIDRYYDILGAVKNAIRKQGVPYFAYFAESFLPPRDEFGYGEEIDHLEASDAEVTLGNLQSHCVGSPDFVRILRTYLDLRQSRACAPSFTVITADKDDPRFDEFYLKGNEVRLFLALFLADMPSYMAMGFETRDVHYQPAPNEHYTKLYVFQETIGPKATSGPYQWGRNGHLFGNLTRLRQFADGMFGQIAGRPTRWLLHPDATGDRKVIAWTQEDARPDYIFLANLDTENHSSYFALPAIPGLDTRVPLSFEFSTVRGTAITDPVLAFNGRHYRVNDLAAGEGRVYRVG